MTTPTPRTAAELREMLVRAKQTQADMRTTLADDVERRGPMVSLAFCMLGAQIQALNYALGIDSELSYNYTPVPTTAPVDNLALSED